MKSVSMANNKVAPEKLLSFRQAIALAVETPRLTHKQINELKKQGKLPTQKRN